MSAPAGISVIRCGPEHAGPILEIFNDAILTSTALYEYRPRTPETMQTWFEAKRRGNFPVIGAIDGAGTLLGFGSYGAFRAFPAYKYTVEHSVYVRKDRRGQGLGRLLLEAVIAAAQEQEYHTLLGVIDASNAASLSLHQSLGFERCAAIREAGFKFGRWLDVEFHQLILPTPGRPVDG